MRPFYMEKNAGTYADDSGDRRSCDIVVAYSGMGIETYLYIDSETRKLIGAEQIDGDWKDLDLKEAKKQFSDILYACQ